MTLFFFLPQKFNLKIDTKKKSENQKKKSPSEYEWATDNFFFFYCSYHLFFVRLLRDTDLGEAEHLYFLRNFKTKANKSNRKFWH